MQTLIRNCIQDTAAALVLQQQRTLLYNPYDHSHQRCRCRGWQVHAAHTPEFQSICQLHMARAWLQAEPELHDKPLSCHAMSVAALLIQPQTQPVAHMHRMAMLTAACKAASTLRPPQHGYEIATSTQSS
jgi:hypothetical protein